MMVKHIIIPPLAIILVGCVETSTALLQDLSSNLTNKVTPAQQPKKTDQSIAFGKQALLLTGDSYQKSISYKIPEKVQRSCKKDAYIKGLEYGYVTYWNRYIKDKIALHHLTHQYEPSSETAKHNYQLYANKHLLDDIVSEYSYTYRLKTNDKDEFNFCENSGFKAGETKGMSMARSDYKKLEKMEKI